MVWSPCGSTDDIDDMILISHKKYLQSYVAGFKIHFEASSQACSATLTKTNETTLVQACAVLTREFRDFE